MSIIAYGGKTGAEGLTAGGMLIVCPNPKDAAIFAKGIAKGNPSQSFEDVQGTSRWDFNVLDTIKYKIYYYI